MKPIVLAGLPGAGKTTLGAALAMRLGLHFIDVDQIIERRTKLTIAKLFERLGEAGFRRLEREVTIGLVEEEDLVIALGGGAFQDEITRARLLKHCITIWLDPPHDVLLDRLRNAPQRPLFLNRDYGRVLAQLSATRQAAFAQAHIRIAECRIEPAIAEIARMIAPDMEGGCGL